MKALSVRVLGPGDEAALEAFLVPRVESSMFLIGNMRAAGLSYHGQAYEGTYVAAFENGDIAGVVAHYWNGVLILQAPVHLDALCTVAVERSQRGIEGLIGPIDQVEAARQLFHIDGSSIQMDEAERLYSLVLEELDVPAILASGQVKGRRVEARDLDLITERRVAYAIEALGEEDGPQLREECRASAQRSLEEGRSWVLEEGGRPVAFTSFNTAIAEAVQVGGVWTPPELRRRGYGRSVVAVSLLDARAEGVDRAILFTGEGNIAAQRAYEALGFRHIGHYRILLLRSPLRHVA